MSKGDHFVIQKGKAKCNKGSSFPSFKVTSHSHHYWNDGGGNAGNLAVTEDDVQFTPASSPFGSCKLKKNDPCSFSPVGKWTNTYDKTTILGKKCVIESSKLQCAVGGKISVMSHGQSASVSQSNVQTADPDVQQELDPLTDINDLVTDGFPYVR